MQHSHFIEHLMCHQHEARRFHMPLIFANEGSPEVHPKDNNTFLSLSFYYHTCTLVFNLKQCHQSPSMVKHESLRQAIQNQFCHLIHQIEHARLWITHTYIYYLSVCLSRTLTHSLRLCLSISLSLLLVSIFLQLVLNQAHLRKTM